MLHATMYSSCTLINTRNMPHATCHMLHATCHRLHASCLYATYLTTMQLQKVLSNSSPHENARMALGVVLADQSFEQSISISAQKESRSWSPVSPSMQSQPTKPFFQSSAVTFNPSACVICLGRHHHNVRTCNSTTTFDGRETKSC